eukprot:GEMP01013900.1.p2 GENE.GEMP01013900.1~~GEMP01013900.1.p2  ORF type:complete len:413 (-),score=87.58 GEMP01013900.1:252-1490(-)
MTLSSRTHNATSYDQERVPLLHAPTPVLPTQNERRKSVTIYYVEGNGPREIELSVTATQVGNIDTREETCTAKLWVDVCWLATQEEATDPNASSGFDLSRNFQLMNAVTLDKHEVVSEPQLKTVGKQTKWHAVMEVIGTFHQNFHLQQFPLDCQVLSIIVEMGNVRDMVYAPAPDKDNFLTVEMDLCPLTGWTLLGAGIEFSGTDPKLSKSGSSYARAIIQVGLSRDWQVYFWRVMAVLFMMQVSVLLMWTIDGIEEFNDRVQFAFLLLLTLVSFQASIHDELPKVNYMTLLEQYTLQGTMFIFVVIILNGIFFYVYKHLGVDESENEEHKLRRTEWYVTFDRSFSYVTLAVLIIQHACLVPYAFHHRRELLVSCLRRIENPSTREDRNFKVGHHQRQKKQGKYAGRTADAA